MRRWLRRRRRTRFALGTVDGFEAFPKALTVDDILRRIDDRRRRALT